MQPNTRSQYEPDIDDILEDPVMLALLKRDGLTVNDVRQVIANYRKNTSSALN